MSDLISRQDAIDALERKKDKNAKGDIGGFYNKIIQNDIDTLMQMPSAQPEQRWIPCSEKMPDDYTDILVWFEYFRYGDYNCLYQTYGIGSYSTEYDSWMINHETGWRKLRVLAWMPLPEPYGGEQE